MKNTLLICLIAFCAFTGFAQDTIVKRSSEIIIAKILEISPTEIRYKKFDFQDGPTYIEIKSKVQMIRFANGMKEIFEEEKVRTEIKIAEAKDDYIVKETPVSNKIDQWGQNKFRHKNHMYNEREIQNVLLKTNDKKIMSLVGKARDAKKAQYFGFAGIPLGIGAGGLFLASVAYGGGSNNFGFSPRYLAGAAVCAAAAIACPVLAVTFKTKRNNCNRAAVKLYNEKF